MDRFPINDIISLVSGEAPRFDLSESCGPHARLREIVGNAPSELLDLELGYGNPHGDIQVRQFVGSLHGVEADTVVLTNGAIQALFLMAYILCRPGDEVVVGSPMFPLARNVVESIGAMVYAVQSTFDCGYVVTANAVQERLTQRTKLVSLATPQNPSGVAVPLATIRQILDAMEQVCPDAYLIVDETYREAPYDPTRRAETAIGLSPRVVSISSLSKCHGTPGLRIGWAIVPDPKLRGQVITGKFNTTISCSPLDEAIALRVLGRHDEITTKTGRVLAEGLDIMERFIRSETERIEWVRPDAGALCCVRLRRDRYDDNAVDQFYHELGKQGVRVASGAWFGDEPRVFRLGFGYLKPDDLRAGLGLLAKALRAAESRTI
jgi:aspartate/methionine/tyrosine aminotransferase